MLDKKHHHDKVANAIKEHHQNPDAKIPFVKNTLPLQRVTLNNKEDLELLWQKRERAFMKLQDNLNKMMYRIRYDIHYMDQQYAKRYKSRGIVLNYGVLDLYRSFDGSQHEKLFGLKIYPTHEIEMFDYAITVKF
ncbi:hypothetical protein [Formosa sp. A9]|uniref:hypothetical protein n=1 Tax=Formosa sp. A9 TaxID=3442641 RepID=UPI003EBA6B45